MVLSLQEVSQHNKKDDCWVIIHDKAYDLSDFIDEHPGGSAIIMKYAGKDATKAFDPIHPGDTLTKYLQPKYHKGEVEKKKKKKKQPSTTTNNDADANKTAKEAPVSQETVDEFDVEYDEQDNKAAITSSVEVNGKDSNNNNNNEDDEYDDDDDDPPTEEELKRRQLVKNKPDISQIYNLYDFEFVARHTMDPIGWAYYSSSADGEATFRLNTGSYQRILFKPRVMIDVTEVDTSTTMLGTNVSAPFYITATALGKLGHPDGEKVLTRGAYKHDIIQMIPTLASCSFDEIVDESKPNQTQWFQLYVNSDREITKKIVQHAEARGMKGLFITVDAPQLGRREKDMKTKSIVDLSFVQGEDDEADRSQGSARAISSFIDTSLSWKDLEWFKSITKMPIILKGVQRVEDAIIAAEHGCAGVVLSNHGGRQLEFSPPPIEVLAELMPILREKGLADKFEVYIDGGVRRATDVLKAICLGAKGVGIGRPFLYAMTGYGDAGVNKAIQLLKDEMVMNMRLLGVNKLEELNESFVDTRFMQTRYVPDDVLFNRVYEPVPLPKFKDTKL
ncbi:L-lactate dehydrogenase [cytochrome], putative [Candida dubliniensis CD36]|uniref:L-lactate dehydrogenase (cytochrome) n=1 Tax=Candida dubliniensis (strain CD36 / ATCC MYA-646 / CBS 7987 / NCPF 3949 / NRRL Y-17841) TaxID=573826 RepID=B9W9Y0_CANDC|nr:L-lactate dehydrogenase [cytochrome], putative [Candida dubliniensis CD36]CAX45618.1 L-lactate dehydrogenase [cytochrome], putative [Candida dubliniensis CD36]